MLQRSLPRILFLIFIATSFVFASLPLFAFTQHMNSSIENKLRKLETTFDCRIGVYAINTGNKTSLQYRAEERFPMCSTIKAVVVAAILKKSMTDEQLLQKKIIYYKNDLAPYSPITKQHVSDGMTVSNLCAATIKYSDSTAVNLLIKQLGGIKAVNAFARSIGDNAFRLDRKEPRLNSAIPGDLRDTTTPKAMAKSLQLLTLGDVLASAQRKLFRSWLIDNTTGNSRIRAGIPRDWLVGDKTGTGYFGTTNDVGILWPPNCSPIIVTIYLTQNKKEATSRSDLIASITHTLIGTFASNDQCVKMK